MVRWAIFAFTAATLASPGQATPQERVIGPWTVSTSCGTGVDLEGCVSTMFQTVPTISLTLIFRDAFEMRASVRSCDREHELVRFRPDAGAWRSQPAERRIQRAREFAETWLAASLSGCATNMPSDFSMDEFDRVFTELEGVSE